MGYVIKYQSKHDNEYRLIRNSGIRTPMVFDSSDEIDNFLMNVKQHCNCIDIVEFNSKKDLDMIDMLSKNTNNAFAKS